MCPSRGRGRTTGHQAASLSYRGLLGYISSIFELKASVWGWWLRKNCRLGPPRLPRQQRLSQSPLRSRGRTSGYQAANLSYPVIRRVKFFHFRAQSERPGPAMARKRPLIQARVTLRGTCGFGAAPLGS